MSDSATPSSRNKDDPKATTVIGLVLFVSCGVLVLTVIIVFAKRHIMRIAMRSKSGKYTPICHGVPNVLKTEVRRRINRSVDVKHEPKLIPNENTANSITTSDFGQLPHLYRMKGLDACRVLEKHLYNDYHIYPKPGEDFAQLLKRGSETLPLRLKDKLIDEFCRLYIHARFESTPFTKENYNSIIICLTQLQNILQGAHHPTRSQYRPIAHIDEITDDVLEPPHHDSNAAGFSQAIVTFAQKYLQRKKNKKEYQSVPSTESLENLEETINL